MKNNVGYYNQTRQISTLKDLMTKPASNAPKKDVFRIRTSKDTYKSISWKAFCDDVNALGTILIEKGLSGENICVIGENSYEWVLTYLAVVNGVGVIVPIDKELTDEEIQNIIIDSKAKAVVFSKTFENTMLNMADRLSSVEQFICMNSNKDTFVSMGRLLELGFNLISKGNSNYIDNNIDINKVCTIIYTSGTTGMSKGVMLSQKNLIANIKAAASMVHCGKDDVVVSILPIHHTYEFTCNILAVLLCEATICFNESIKHLSDNLKLFKPTLLFLVPLIAETVYKKIIAEAIKSGKIKKMKIGIRISNILRTLRIDIRNKLFSEVQAVFGGRLKKVVVGGAPMNPNIAKGYRDIGILLLQGYGITECSPLVAVNCEIKFNDKSAGLIVPCNEVKISDNEILVKGDNVMFGYYNNDIATQEAFDGDWFKTGDLGYIDKDGFLYITGRKKNLIILSNGKNVHPEELEGCVANIEGVIEVLVYEENGTITAEIYPDSDKENVQVKIKDDILSLNKTLPTYKQINTVKFRNLEFIKTTTKKIKRNQIGEKQNV